MILLLDIGNTRLKWAWLEAGVLGPQRALLHTNVDRAHLMDEVLDAKDQPERVLIANVGGPEMALVCAEAIAQRWKLSPEFIQATSHAAGVTNAYREPEKLGIDRWLAVIAAHAMQRGAACVVSIGTAMTIDGVNASGLHLGGIIVPGPELMISSLLNNTSEIGRRMSGEAIHHGIFANHTQGAVRQGCAHALAALVDRVIGEMTQSLGNRPLLLITGGASEPIAPLLNGPYETHANLVLRGLAIVAGGREV
jgi:type III pantothenate kinase